MDGPGHGVSFFSVKAALPTIQQMAKSDRNGRFRDWPLVWEQPVRGAFPIFLVKTADAFIR